MTMTSIGEMAMHDRLWPEASLMGADAVEASAVIAQNCSLRFCGEFLHIINYDLHHRLVLARERAHWPIGTDHETAPSKCGAGDIQVAVEVTGAPLIPFRLRHHGRKLAGNVRQFRQLVQILLPG